MSTEDRAPAARWLGRVRARLRRWGVERVVVAVSGGGDSVGLLRILHGLDLSLSVAHLHHGVRGEAAEADARFVAELAGARGVPFDLGRWQPGRPGHFEADARRARYEWLAEVARTRGAEAVAVGHTRDDQAETILHRILRGTGPAGLAGMPARRPLVEGVALVRPILSVSRQEIRAFLAEIGQEYREDVTNADVSRTRSRIRHDLLPKLAAEYNPKVAEALVRLGALAGAAHRALAVGLEERERAATLSAGGRSILLDRAALRAVPPYLRAEILRRAWRRAGWPEAGMGAARWRRLAALARRPMGRASVGGGVEATCGPDALLLERAGPAPPADRPRPGPVPLPIPGAADWGGGRIVATLDPDAPRDEAIDLDRLEPPLVVRAPEPGDRVAPLGLGGRSQPLNDFFRGRGVPRAARGEVPLVCDARGIVWVVGHRIGDRVRVTAATGRILGLRRDSD